MTALPRPRPCRACLHVHGGRAFGICMVPGCDCVEVVEKPKPIDYLAEKTTIGIVELIELDNDILAGESGAEQIAERLDISTRTVERRRKYLRQCGYRIRIIEIEDRFAVGSVGRAR